MSDFVYFVSGFCIYGDHKKDEVFNAEISLDKAVDCLDDVWTLQEKVKEALNRNEYYKVRITTYKLFRERS